jgi:hypothetical protein
VVGMTKVLLIGGSLNQTTQMHQIAKQLTDFEFFFSPLYADGLEDIAARQGWLDHTALGGQHRKDTLEYLSDHRLPVDDHAKHHKYDLVITCTDLILPANIRNSRLVLVQEGITTPENSLYHLVKTIPFMPRYLANTSATGLSDAYDLFCIASEGYRDLFIRKGVRPEKLAVTGIPNFDHLSSFIENSFPYQGYVLVATTPLRENMQFEDRGAFIRRCVNIAAGRQLIFKLHPLEDFKRASKEIQRLAPGALIYTSGNINPMIANAEVVITQQSTCTYVAIALNKEVYSMLNVQELRRLMPIQNNGSSAQHIGSLCRKVLQTPMPLIQRLRRQPRSVARARKNNELPKGIWESI